MSINNDHEPLQPSGFTAAEEISGLEKQHVEPHITIGEYKHLEIPEHHFPDPNNLTGYMRNVHYNTQTHTGSADLVEGYSRNHGLVRYAENEMLGLANKDQYYEGLSLNDEVLSAEVRYAIDFEHDQVKFEVHVGEGDRDELSEAVQALVAAWTKAHGDLLDKLEPETQFRIIGSAPHLGGGFPDQFKYWAPLSWIWRDGQVDQDYLERTIDLAADLKRAEA